jgi:glycosyltransferase involved in cell wall biosynthesis
MKFEMNISDAIICASEKQRDLWLGVLLAIGRIDPTGYMADKNARQVIDVVSFGIQEKPKRYTPMLRKHFDLSKNDFVLLWGGGIWNWFDPLTPIRAVAELNKTRNDIKLVFLGTKHPHIETENVMYSKAVELADELGVTNKSVFFNEEWVDYKDIYNYFKDADVGVSTHFDHLETSFSFRTRCLDYLWAELPIITTEGDYFADFVTRNQIGYSVKFGDPSQLASKIVEMRDDKTISNIYKANTQSHNEILSWRNQVSNLGNMIESTLKTKPKANIYIRVYFLWAVRFKHRLMNVISNGNIIKSLLRKLSA